MQSKFISYQMAPESRIFGVLNQRLFRLFEFLRFQRLFFWLLVLKGISATALAVHSIFRVGTGWDADIDSYAVFQIMRLPSSISLDQATEKVISTSEYYGILIQRFAEFFHNLTGGKSDFTHGWLDTYVGSDWSSRYRWQAAVTLVLAVTGAAVLAWTIATITRSRNLGAMIWATLLSMPSFLGLAIVNFKDVPIAVGLMLVSSALALVQTRKKISVQLWIPTTLFGIGLSLMLCVRAGSWPIIFGLIAFVILFIAILNTDLLKQGEFLRDLILVTLFGAAFTLVSLVILNPFARINLLRWLFDAALVMNRYPHQVDTLTLGTLVPSNKVPWWYFPSWIAAQTPVIALLVAILGFGILALKMFQALKIGSFGSQYVWLSPFIGLIVIAIMIPLAGSTLYDGSRQLTFALPAFVVLAVVGVSEISRVKIFNVTLKIVPHLLIVFVVTFNLHACYRWSPYMYSFLNPIAQPRTAERHWETDYWGVTAREGIDRLRDLGLEPLTVRPTARTATVNGAIDEAWIKGTGAETFGLYQFLIRRDSSIPRECRELFRVKRDGITLGIGAECPTAILSD